MKGRVVICREYSKPFEIEEFEVPDPEPGAVLLRMTQAGICGSDLHTWRGDQINVPLPPNGRVMGHEGTGVVDKLAPVSRPTLWACQLRTETGLFTLPSSRAITATCA